MVIVAGSYAIGFCNNVIFFTNSDMWVIGNSEGMVIEGEYVPGLPEHGYSIWGLR